MAYTTIKNSTAQFNSNIFTGNNTTQTFTGFNFQPDMTWLKKRNGAANHHLVDAVRGVGRYLYPNLTNAEGGSPPPPVLLTAFNSDGYTIDDGEDANATGATGVGWSWKAGNLANEVGTSNGDGSITSSVSANTVGGFSIVKFTGTGANATVGHGLGAVPKMMIFKNVDQATEGWMVYHVGLGNTKKMNLDSTTSSSSSSTFWQDTTPTSSVFSVGSNHGMNGPDSMIAYCWADKVGYSKFGKYLGNGDNDGTFVYTGFKPAFVMIKKDGSDGWQMFDDKRDASNPEIHRLEADSDAGDYTGLSAGWVDFVSNGFKVRYSGGGVGSNGSDYIYMAFAAEPLVGDNPATAR